MSFPWYEPVRRKPNPQRRDEVEKQELEERAALLHRLGYGKAQVKARLRANLSWDYELRGQAMPDRDVDKIVDAVYKRGGGSGPPTV